MTKDRFGEDYYARFYEDRKTRVAGPVYSDRPARFIGAYIGFLEIRIRSILGLGCGTETLRKPLLKRFPQATYTGVDISSYACAKVGWEFGSAGG